MSSYFRSEALYEKCGLPGSRLRVKKDKGAEQSWEGWRPLPGKKNQGRNLTQTGSPRTLPPTKGFGHPSGD